MFQGIPGIECAPGGRLWATWYAGGFGESMENYVLLATSGDDGKTWSKPVLAINPPFRASEPGLWLDPDKRLWFFFNLYPVRKAGEDLKSMEEKYSESRSYKEFVSQNNFIGSQLWAMTTDNPDSPGPVWSEPRLLTTEVYNLNKPTVLSNGTWVWPSASFKSVRHLPVSPLYSADNGASFRYRGDVPVPMAERNADEPMIVERKDGSLWMLNRMSYGIGESISYDQGGSWTEMSDTFIPHTASRFYIRRLRSGKLLLVKHGAMDANIGRDRSQLMAFLSDDDGETWSGGLMLDVRSGVSYPDGTQAEDGRIYIIYDFERHGAKEILMAVFTEADVAAGKAVSEAARFRVLVSKATAFNPRHGSEVAPADFIPADVVKPEGFRADSHTDDFNREASFKTESTLNSESWANARSAGRWGIVDGAVSVESTLANAAVYNNALQTFSGNGAGFTLSVDLCGLVLGTWGGVIFNYQDKDNFYLFKIKFGTPDYQVFMRKNGEDVKITAGKAGSIFNTGVFHTVTVGSSNAYEFALSISEAADPQKVILNNCLVVDQTRSFAGGYGGFVQGNRASNRMLFDNFSLEVF